MKRKLLPLLCTLSLILPLYLLAQKAPQPATKAPVKTHQISKPVTQKPTATKPLANKPATTVRPVETRKTTPTPAVHHQPAVATHRPVEQKEIQPVISKPNAEVQQPEHSESTNTQPIFAPKEVTGGTKSGPAKGVNKEALIWKSFLKYRYQNYGDAKRENRHCGCGADIELVNPTAEPLDVYIKYASNGSLPTLEDAIIPEIRRSFLYPTFVIPAGETITIRGTCNGGFIYEVTTHVEKSDDKSTKSGKLIDPAFIDHGFVRGNCVNKTVVFENEKTR
ncbi:MAG: hypothetical protein K1X54_13370 [Flavobacteriales bacterium]|nr:hypothetical protein [Flavobacteriales bacterium]